ncbi:MAG TPA: uracil-DNA glycosylase [Burkholderiaceae bacterium]|nr:uracil-DNA glycosylase [Burkholderiaceae bacterium]
MRWSERQRAMLGAMGITLWLPPDASAAPAAVEPAPPERAASVARAMVPEAPASDVADIATLDWEALRTRVASCRACRLCESRTQTVFGVGNPHAHCMIVGEAPGEKEDLQGEPFVGSAGQLLDRMLPAIGLTRAPAEPAQQVFIANTLKCRPPRNRNPEPAELVRCSVYLIRQIELVQPKLLLAMGRFAVQVLLDSAEPIGRLRGRVHRWRDLPVVVTYHPAYLLRNPADKARAWADLCLAATLLAR